jgi:hypothetical protein
MGMIVPFGRYLYETEYLFITMVLMHLAIAYCMMSETFVADKKRVSHQIKQNVPVLVLLGLLVAFFAISFLVRPIGAIFGIVEISIPYFLLSFVSPVVTAVMFLILGNVRMEK